MIADRLVAQLRDAFERGLQSDGHHERFGFYDPETSRIDTFVPETLFEVLAEAARAALAEEKRAAAPVFVTSVGGEVFGVFDDLHSAFARLAVLHSSRLGDLSPIGEFVVREWVLDEDHYRRRFESHAGFCYLCGGYAVALVNEYGGPKSPRCSTHLLDAIPGR